MYIRYKAVEVISYMTLNDNRRLFWLNRSSLIVGLISAFGTSLVANFQVRQFNYIRLFLYYILPNYAHSKVHLGMFSLIVYENSMTV